MERFTLGSRNEGAKVYLSKKEEGIVFMELDEMHTYVGSKKTTAGYGLPLTDLESGFRFCQWRSFHPNRSKILGRNKGYSRIVLLFGLLEKLPSLSSTGKHLQTKAETFTIEGYNSRIRHYLARFKRKGKCYGKAQHMIDKSLKLLFLKLNNELPILIW